MPVPNSGDAVIARWPKSRKTWHVGRVHDKDHDVLFVKFWCEKDDDGSPYNISRQDKYTWGDAVILPGQALPPSGRICYKCKQHPEIVPARSSQELTPVTEVKAPACKVKRPREAAVATSDQASSPASNFTRASRTNFNSENLFTEAPRNAAAKHATRVRNAGAEEPGVGRGKGSHKKLPEELRQKLIQWAMDHLDHPYPGVDDMRQLMLDTELLPRQITTFLTNWRHRGKRGPGPASADNVKGRASSPLSILSDSTQSTQSTIKGPVSPHGEIDVDNLDLSQLEPRTGAKRACRQRNGVAPAEPEPPKSGSKTTIVPNKGYKTQACSRKGCGKLQSGPLAPLCVSHGGQKRCNADGCRRHELTLGSGQCTEHTSLRPHSNTQPGKGPPQHNRNMKECPHCDYASPWISVLSRAPRCPRNPAFGHARD
eukprot:gene7792-1397_t